MKREAISMEPTALAWCVKALDCDEADVLAMCESGDLSFALQAAQVLALRQRYAAGSDDDHAGQFCRAVLTGWGESPFTARQLLDWCAKTNTRERREAMTACRMLCHASSDVDRELTTVQLGVALKRAASETESAKLRLESAGAARGVTQWQVRGLRG